MSAGHGLAVAITLLFAASARAAPSPVAVYPIPGSRLATPQTQITFRGVPAGELGPMTVTGSSSGLHTGRIEADSDGHGGSFIPDSPFVPGEVVTVTTGLSILGTNDGVFSFTIEQPAGGIAPPGRLPTPPRVAGDVDSFRSRPDLHPPAVRINQGRPIGNDIFLTPMRGPLQWGPMIVDPAGRLVWFHPLPGSKEQAADLRVQAYGGQPVLTWWQGYQNAGLGQGEDVIFNEHYQQIATVNAGNGLRADLHEFTITSQGTALITAYQLVHWDASAVGGLKDSAVQDCVVQEIDIATGLVLFQWDSLDHVPVTDSYARAGTQKRPYDYFHVNSVQQAPDGSLIVSARNTWAVYDIDHQTGKVIWTLGGKHSDFKMGPGTSTAYQHHARDWPDGLFTIFDDGASPQVHKQSRGIIERVNTGNRTVTLVRALDHSPELVTPYEGSVQPLTHGNVFVGWGALPFFTQFGAKGKQIYDGRFIDENSSYRAYRFPWTGQPDTPPALAVWAGGAGVAHVYASWNGATGVSSWRVLAGPSPGALSPVAQSRRSGFETPISVPTGERYFAVQAVGERGTLGTSPVQALPPHLAVFGRTAFVAGASVGSLPVYCYATRPCSVTTTVQAGRTTIADTRPSSIAAGSGAIVQFKLTAAGREMLLRAPAGGLPVRVTTVDPPGISGSTALRLIPFFTRGHGPARSGSPSPSAEVLAQTGFVSATGVGQVLAGCTADTPCRVRATVSVGATTIARSGPEGIGARQLRYLVFTLTPEGKTMLARAPGNQLGVKLTITNDGDTAGAQIALVRVR